jgi:hypothetical protein
MNVNFIFYGLFNKHVSSWECLVNSELEGMQKGVVMV